MVCDDVDLQTQFCQFLNECCCPFSFCNYSRRFLAAHGFAEVAEDVEWGERPNRGFVVRDGRALIAWVGNSDSCGVVGALAHCDSPGARVRQVPLCTEDGVTRLNVTWYGGPVRSSWNGRNLKLVGRCFTADGQCLLVDSVRPIAFCDGGGPVVAVNRAVSFDDVLGPLLPEGTSVLAHELRLVDTEPAMVVGQMVSAARLDNLSSAFACLRGITSVSVGSCLKMIAVFDNEEVGSLTLAGARSNFLSSIIARLLGDSPELDARVRANSAFLSIDAAHAAHPAYFRLIDGPGFARFDSAHRPVMGGGTVIKTTPNGGYASSIGLLRWIQEVAERKGLPLQHFMHRGSGGSTIGPHVARGTGVRVLDLGPPQLAMHSIRETMAFADLASLVLLVAGALETPPPPAGC